MGKTNCYAILIIEHDWDDLYLLLEFLNLIGVDAVVAEDRIVAIEMLRKDIHQIGLVIVDTELQVDAYEVAKTIRSDAALWHLYVVALTAHHTPAVEEHAFRTGINFVMTKPYDPKALRKLTSLLGLVKPCVDRGED